MTNKKIQTTIGKNENNNAKINTKTVKSSKPAKTQEEKEEAIRKSFRNLYIIG